MPISIILLTVKGKSDMNGNMMNAAVLNKPFDIEVKQLPIPEPKEDEVLIRVHCIGICGSDVHYYEHGRIGRYVVEAPLILGHELAGEVVQTGARVTNVSAGDRVAVEPGVTCGRCTSCKEGRYNLCPDVQFMATPPVDGAWAEYVTIRSDFVFKLPDGVSYEEGAMIEPLSVGLHAMKRGRVAPSDRVLVTGLGPIGLLSVVAAKLYGVNEIYGTDVIPSRRKLAEELGITKVIDPSVESVAERLEELTGGEGVDVVVESSGNARVVSDTVKLVKRGGRIVLVGMPAEDDIPLNVNQIIDGELDVMGIFRYANTYPDAISLLSRSDLDIEKIITHKFALKDIKEAIETARTQKDASIKIMIYPHM